MAGFAGYGEQVGAFPGLQESSGVVEAGGVAGQTALIDRVFAHRFNPCEVTPRQVMRMIQPMTIEAGRGAGEIRGGASVGVFPFVAAR